jgi:hypothetical protein
MSEKKPITDSSIARMAGNIAAGFCSHGSTNMSASDMDTIAYVSVCIARKILEHIEAPAPQGVSWNPSK